MKKVLSVLLSVAILFTMTVMAFATDITGNASSDAQSDTAIVKTSTTNENGEDVTSFTVTYPAETTSPWEKLKAVDIAYTVTTQLMFDKRLNVTVTTADSKMEGSAGNVATLDYTLGGDVNFTTDSAVANVSKAATVTVADSAWAAVPVDTYQDTLTFTVSVVDA